MNLCESSPVSISILIVFVFFVDFIHFFLIVKKLIDVILNKARFSYNNLMSNLIRIMSQLIILSSINQLYWRARIWYMRKNQIVLIHICMINTNLNNCSWINLGSRKTTRADLDFILIWLLFFLSIVLSDLIAINHLSLTSSTQTRLSLCWSGTINCFWSLILYNRWLNNWHGSWAFKSHFIQLKVNFFLIFQCFGRFLVRKHPLFIHFVIWNNTYLLYETQKERWNSKFIKLLVQRVQIKSPKLLRNVQWNMVASYQVIQMVWICNNDWVMRIFRINRYELKRLIFFWM